LPPRRCWPPRAPAPDAGPQSPILVAIRADPRRSKPRELLIYVPKRASSTQGPPARSKADGGTPAATGHLTHEQSTQAPIAAPCHHPGRSASFEAQRATRSRAQASRAAYIRARGLPARSRADGSPPAAAGRHAHQHQTQALNRRSLSPSGPIRVVQSRESCPSACPSEPRSLRSGPEGASKVLSLKLCEL